MQDDKGWFIVSDEAATSDDQGDKVAKAIATGSGRSRRLSIGKTARVIIPVN